MFEKQRQLMPVQYIERLIYRYQADDLASMSAQIAYYLILAFFPFLIFLINVLSFTSLSSELLLNNFIAFLPKETGVLVKDILVRTVQAKSTTLLFFGILTSLWAGSRGIAAIIRGLNKSYEVDENRNFFALSLVALISTVGCNNCDNIQFWYDNIWQDCRILYLRVNGSKSAVPYYLVIFAILDSGFFNVNCIFIHI